MQPLYLVAVHYGGYAVDRPQAMTAPDVWARAEWLAINGAEWDRMIGAFGTLMVEPIDR